MKKAIAAWIDHPWWRALESVHTVIWIGSGVATVATFLYGLMEHIPAMWFASIPVILVVMIFLGERIYRRISYCSLPDASTRIYSKLKNTTGLGAFTKGGGGSPADVLDEVATAISQEVPILGKEPPSLTLEVIPALAFRQGAITGGGAMLRRYNEEHPSYIDLAIRRSDVGRAMKQIKKNWDDLAKARQGD